MRVMALGLVLIIGLTATGCGTIWSIKSGRFAPYSGIQESVEWTTDWHPRSKFFGWTDVPHSFFLDTVLLPFSLLYWLFFGDSAQDKERD